MISINKETKENLRKLAEQKMINHFFCNVNEPEFPDDIWDTLDSADQEAPAAYLENAVVWEPFENMWVGRLKEVMEDFQEAIYLDFLKAIEIYILTKD